MTDLRSWRRLLLWGVVLLVVATAAMLLLHLLSWPTLPQTRGERTIMGLSGTVTVSRDGAGVPRVVASSDQDAVFALGYLHAQDRLWQMDYARRTGQGRLAEILGRRALASDQLMRTLGLTRAADQAIGSLSDQSRLLLSAYADGVNAFLREGRPLPIEFHMFGVRPARWSPADSLLMIKLLAFSLGANHTSELANATLVGHLGPARAAELLDIEIESGMARLDRVEAIQMLAAAEAAVAALGVERDGIGSNGWAVSGALTDNGAPLLAGDPHLPLQLPSTFYLASIKGDRLDVSGATLPGVPLVIFGQNSSIAWTGTNLAADVQDLFIEHVAVTGDRVQRADGWEAIEVHEELIEVMPDFPAFLRTPYEPLRWQVRSSSHGPLISDALRGAEQVVALRWTALDPSDTSFDAFLAINLAEDLDSFQAALTLHVAPALAFIYADREGNIALLPAGRIPIRKRGNGTVPLPGHDASYGWAGYLATDELPRIVNPPGGYVVSANNRYYAEGPLISNSWQPDYRARRIADLIREGIAEGARLSPDDLAAMQLDVVDLQALELRELLIRQQGVTRLEQAAIDAVKAWDGRMAAESSAAAIYHFWSAQFLHLLVDSKLKVNLVAPGRLDVLRGQAEQFRPNFLRRVATGELAHWCGEGADACDRLAVEALGLAVRDLTRLAGKDVSDWRWGDVHRTRLSHVPLARVPILRPWLEFERPSAGGRYSVNVALGPYARDTGYLRVFGAAYRQVIDLAQPERSLFAIEGGQSGNPADWRFAPWQGWPRPLRGTEVGGGEILTLSPAPEQNHGR